MGRKKIEILKIKDERTRQVYILYITQLFINNNLNININIKLNNYLLFKFIENVMYVLEIFITRILDSIHIDNYLIFASKLIEYIKALQ